MTYFLNTGVVADSNTAILRNATIRFDDFLVASLCSAATPYQRTEGSGEQIVDLNMDSLLREHYQTDNEAFVLVGHNAVPL